MAYIDRDKAIAYVEEQYRLFKDDEGKQAIVEGCVEALKFTPTADVEKVRHGEWIYHECVSSNEGAISGYSCSRCCYFVDEEIFDRCEYSTEYCGHCGARMDGGKNE